VRRRRQTIGTTTEIRDVQEILDQLTSLEERSRKQDEELKEVFKGLGYQWGEK